MHVVLEGAQFECDVLPNQRSGFRSDSSNAAISLIVNQSGRKGKKTYFKHKVMKSVLCLT